MMDKMIEKIAAELTKRFLANDGEHCSISMKEDGAQLALTLCSDDRDKKLQEGGSILDFDYILVYGNAFTQTLMGEPEQVCRNIANYHKKKTEWQEDVVRLKKYCRKHIDKDFCGTEYEYFSDWHKDLFGYRPRGWVVNEKGVA